MYKKIGFSLLSAAVVASAPSQAMEFKVSGQLNTAVMNVDDGRNNETYFVDNTNSSSRFRFTGSGQLENGPEVGFAYEMEFESNPSASVSEANPSISGELQERLAEVYVKGEYGQLNLGQGNGAANGITHIDLSGTNVAALLGHYHLFGGATLFQEDGIEGPSVSGSTANFDFESRYDRVAYYAPKIGSVSLAASVGRKDDSVYELSARYSAFLGENKIAAGVGFSRANVDAPADSNDIVGGSASILHPSGINAAISYSNKSDDAEYDSTNTSVRLGYKSGKHATSVDYALTEDRAQEGDEVDVVSLNYVYKPIGWAEFYASVRQFMLDRMGSDYDDIRVAMMGTRVKF